MIEIVGALLSILVTLLPTFLAYRAERKPIKERESIDAILISGSDADVSVLLSRLHDEASGRTAGQSSASVPDTRGEAL